MSLAYGGFHGCSSRAACRNSMDFHGIRMNSCNWSLVIYLVTLWLSSIQPGKGRLPVCQICRDHSLHIHGAGTIHSVT